MTTAKANKTNDRVFVLKQMEGKATESSTGITDKRLFSGENKLHAFLEPNSILWTMKYDSGTLPPALKMRFTSFPKLHAYVEDYFKKRNVEITEVIDI